MNDPEAAGPERIVAALRGRDPDALAELFDAYVDQLFRYCWFVLRSRDIAYIAVRDTLIAAEARIGELADPAALTSWLYALARLECRDRRPVPPADADEPPARPGQPDAESRLMAWNTVTSMEPDDAEMLYLAGRRDVDLELVLGVPGEDARALLDRAREELQRALGAEFLLTRGSRACPDCADCAEVTRDWAGGMTAGLRERLLRHAATCPVCGPSLPRNVSAGRVFALLPAVPLPAGTRERVLDFAADPRTAAYREFAAVRVANLDDSGFPRRQGATVTTTATSTVIAVSPAPPAVAARDESLRARRGRMLAAAGAVAAAATVASVIALGAGALGALPLRTRPAQAQAQAQSQAQATSSAVMLSTPSPRPPGSRHKGRPRHSRVRASPSPSASSSAAAGTLLVSPGTLSLGSGSRGTVELTAEGGTQNWTAGTSSGQLSMSGHAGTLRAGQSVTLVVYINRAGPGPGRAVVYFGQGPAPARSVTVLWAGRSRAPRPRRPAPPSPAPAEPASASPSPAGSWGSSPASYPLPSPGG